MKTLGYYFVSIISDLIETFLMFIIGELYIFVLYVNISIVMEYVTGRFVFFIIIISLISFCKQDRDKAEAKKQVTIWELGKNKFTQVSFYHRFLLAKAITISLGTSK
jgi:hypothetical protein